MENNSEHLLFHGGAEPVLSLEIRITRYTKDFGYGFYCTRLEEQAEKWCYRKSVIGFVTSYRYTANIELNIKKFTENDEWLDFVADCRKGKSHEYDIVEGPMADDQIWDFVDDYLDGNISREEFWSIAKFRHPTHQISFHSELALQSLEYVSHLEVRRDG